VFKNRSVLNGATENPEVHQVVAKYKFACEYNFNFRIFYRPQDNVPLDEEISGSSFD